MKKINIIYIFRKVSCLVVWLNPMWKTVVVNGIPASVESSERPYIFVCNHLSNSDPWHACVLMAQANVEAKFVSKANLFTVPFGGWSMRLAGDVAVKFTKDRSGWGTEKGSTGKMMAVCKDLVVGHHIPLFVYPEGARTRTGHMTSFKDGFFQFCAENGVDIVPVALNGSQHAWSPGDWRMGFATIHVTAGEPISGERNPVRLRDLVRAEIVRLYKGLPNAKADYDVPHPDDVEFERRLKEAVAAEKAKGAAKPADGGGDAKSA